jgi:hypothetical protein
VAAVKTTTITLEQLADLIEASSILGKHDQGIGVALTLEHPVLGQIVTVQTGDAALLVQQA